MNEVRDIQWAEFGVTNVHPFSIGFMIVMIACALAPRRSAVIFGVLAVCVFMPVEQRVVIGGLDFPMLRLFMLVAWFRVFVRGEHHSLRFGKLDRLLVLWTLSSAIAQILRVGPSAIAYCLGVVFDALAAYFLIRVLVRTPVEVLVFWKYVAWIVVVLSPCLIYEATKLHNVFGVFNYSGFDPVMDDFRGEVRAQGPFSHPILAGTFGSIVLPVFVGVLFGLKKGRLLFAVACAGAIAITVTSGSSGPLMAFAAALVGWGIWWFRKYSRQMWWTTILLAVVVHFIREKSIWHLIFVRVSNYLGGSGSHRYWLVEAFISRFHEWALFGTSNMASWGWGLQDATNQYVSEGVTGGLATLVLFFVVLATGFRQLRLARQACERLYGAKSLWALLAWGSSVSLAVHCVSFLSISYFGQMVQFFLFFLATVPAMSRARHPKRVKSQKPSRAANAPTAMPATVAP